MNYHILSCIITLSISSIYCSSLNRSIDLKRDHSSFTESEIISSVPLKKGRLADELIAEDNALQLLPLGISSFRKIIENGYLYVDKTELIHQYIIRRGQYFFLARPRRFGKSLLISTLEEIFAGNSDLFKNLWIGTSSGYSWAKHPIISLDFSRLNKESAETVKHSLAFALDKAAQDLSIDVSLHSWHGDKLIELVTTAYKQDHRGVVVLIDEYDYPLINNLENTDVAKAIREQLKDFFAVLKSLDKHLRAIFITGVSKFSKTSAFSGLNNLQDLSMNPEAASLCGYTESELDFYFQPYFKALALKERKSIEDIRNQIRTWYNGYRFSEDPVKVYNPSSILDVCETYSFTNYWFESGTPSFLVKMLANETNFNILEDIEQAPMSSLALGTFDIENIPVIPLLFQTGYLTIIDYDKNDDTYKLGYPNKEVRESFTSSLFAAFARTDVSTINLITPQIKDALSKCDIPKFCHFLKILFAHIPYQLHIEKEGYYHSLFKLLGLLIGYQTDSEISTDKGRADTVLRSKTHIYLFEFKFKKPLTAGSKQQDSRKYYERYLHEQPGKKIILVSLSFNPDEERLSFEAEHKELALQEPAFSSSSSSSYSGTSAFDDKTVKLRGLSDNTAS